MIDLAMILKNARTQIATYARSTDEIAQAHLAELDEAIKYVGNTYTTLSFGDLRIGDHFIAMPLPGDNSGHGGFLGAHNLLVKIGGDSYATGRGVASTVPRSMRVIKVAL